MKFSVTKRAAESKRKRKRKAVTIFCPLKLFISRLRKKTGRFATSAQFKSISEVLAVFLKLNFGTRMKQTAQFNADLLRMLEQKDWFLSKHNSLMNAFENAYKLLIG